MSSSIVVRIAAAVFEVLRPILKEIKSDIASLKEQVGRFAEESEQYANDTLSQLADLNSSLIDLDTKLGSVRNSMDEETQRESNFQMFVSARLGSLDSKVVAMNDSVTETLGSIKKELVNSTVSEPTLRELVNLNPLGQKMDNLQLNLATMDEKLGNNFTSLETNINSTINSKMASLDDRLRHDFTAIHHRMHEQEDTLSTELMEMRQNLSVEIGGYMCGGTGGWRRAVYLNMTDPNTTCPSGWWLITSNSKRTCGRTYTGRWRTCDSAFFPISGGPYNQVCGTIRAYQWGLPYAFNQFRNNYIPSIDIIDTSYFSGVAVMHGRPRQHLWTFAAGAWENNTGSDYSCPCDATTAYVPVPDFVGKDYFCESGYIYPGYQDTVLERRLHSSDTLWDRRGCHSTSTCCSRDSTDFTKILANSTSDDLELRICGYTPPYQSNIAVELVELYVKQDYIQTTLQKMDTEGKESFRHQVRSMNSLNVYTCGGTGGWRRAVYLDMTDPSTYCPSGWNTTNYNIMRACSRATNGWRTCDSVFFPVGGGSYSQVCGMIRAYQWGMSDAFVGYRYYGQRTINGVYFNGVAVLHGDPRQHIWTFAAGAMGSSSCPCDNNNPIPFVGTDYFCEPGYVWPGFRDDDLELRFHPNNTLWDGECQTATSSCCSPYTTPPPYFTKTLGNSTTNDLELRMCLNDPEFNEDILVEFIEMYVK